jgi:hypothetical protein
VQKQEKIFFTKKIRRLLMIFWFLCFFIISPILILYTAGFKYDFKENKWMQTGVISLDAINRNVSTKLDGVLFDEKLPMRIPNLTAGFYTLEYERPQFKTFKHNVEVRSGETSYIQDIELYRENKETFFYTEIKNRNYFLTEKYIYYLNYSDSIYEIESHKLHEKDGGVIIERGESLIGPKIVGEIKNKIIIETKTDDNFRYLILDKNENKIVESFETKKYG